MKNPLKIHQNSIKNPSKINQQSYIFLYLVAVVVVVVAGSFQCKLWRRIAEGVAVQRPRMGKWEGGKFPNDSAVEVGSLVGS